MTLGWYAKNSSRRNTTIRDKEFYAELLHVITGYLWEYGQACPSKMLQSLLNDQCTYKLGRKPRMDMEGCFSADEVLMNSLLDESTVINGMGPENTSTRYFTEELRYVILKTILRTKCPEEKSVLMECHVWIHLLELHFIDDMSIFEKMNKFLNTNFRLPDDDFVGHACRRNFSDIIRIRPELEQPLEELIPLLDLNTCNRSRTIADSMHSATIKDPNALSRWKERHQINNDLYSIVCGDYTQFSNLYESCCYDLAYKANTTMKNQYLDVINGNVDELLTKLSGWMRLVVLLAFPKKSNLRELESLFESIFHEILGLDHLTALGFLAYSRGLQYHFTVFLTQIPLNDIVVSSLTDFATKSGISRLQVVNKYVLQLQNERKYDELCRCIITYSVTGFCYSEATILYFINNFRKYKTFVEEPFFDDENNKFIYWVYRVCEADYPTLRFLVVHPFSYLAFETIVDAVLTHPQSDEALLIKTLDCVVKSKADKSLVNELKVRILQQLSKEMETPN